MVGKRRSTFAADMEDDYAKGPWRPEEEKLLLEAVQKVKKEEGTENDPEKDPKWPAVAALVPGRNSKSCRLRYTNQVKRQSKGPFTAQEDAFIVQAVDTWCPPGSKFCWARMAKFLEGRTDNAVKNRWNSHIKRQIAHGLTADEMYPGNLIPSPEELLKDWKILKTMLETLTRGGAELEADQSESIKAHLCTMANPLEAAVRTMREQKASPSTIASKADHQASSSRSEPSGSAPHSTQSACYLTENDLIIHDHGSQETDVTAEGIGTHPKQQPQQRFLLSSTLLDSAPILLKPAALADEPSSHPSSSNTELDVNAHTMLLGNSYSQDLSRPLSFGQLPYVSDGSAAHSDALMADEAFPFLTAAADSSFVSC